MPKLLLYYKPTCPFCQKVFNFMKTKGISLPLRNVDEHLEGRKELIEIGGKAQVPCLLIDGKALYESDDIVAWLKENVKK